MPRRFVCTEDDANKFWEGAVEGSALTTRWGKVGTAGQSKTKSFPSAQAAQKELEALVREKVGKGYVEERAGGGGTASPPSPPSPGPAAPTPRLGKYTGALVAWLEDQPKRDVPEPTVTQWLAKETRPGLRALFVALAAHRHGAVSVGDLELVTGGPVPSEDDPSEERDDVITIGNTGGGDPFVTKTPGTSDDESITMILHDEGWSEGERWRSLESFLADRVASWRESEEEQGTPRSEIRLGIEDYLGPRKPAGAETPIARGALTLVAHARPSRDRRDDNLPDDVGAFFFDTRTPGGDWERFWHGRLAFAAVPFAVKDCDGPAYRAAFFDRGGAKPEVRLVEPRIVRWKTTDAKSDSTMLHAWKDDGSSCLVAGAGAVELDFTKKKLDVLRERGRGTIVIADPATGRASVVCEGSADVVAGLSPDTLVALGWAGEMVATIVKGKKGNVVELRARRDAAWFVVRTIPCDKCDELFSIGGNLAVVTKKSGKGKSFVLGVRGADVRLVGVFDEPFGDAFTAPDALLLATVKASSLQWHEVRHVDEALEKAFAAPAGELSLGE